MGFGGVSASRIWFSVGVRLIILVQVVKVESGFSKRDCVLARSPDGFKIYVPLLTGMWKPGSGASGAALIARMRSRRSYKDDSRDIEWL